VLAIEVILYILKAACTSPNGEVRESKHEMKPGANSTGPYRRPHGRKQARGSEWSKIYLYAHEARVCRYVKAVDVARRTSE
jgi:hypothetical protein